MSYSLWLNGLQLTGLSCPSVSPRARSNSCLLSRWCHPTISSSLTSFSCPLLSQHQGLCQWVSSLHQVAKDWSFSFSISPSNEYSVLISFRMDWFDLAVQGTLKSLPYGLKEVFWQAVICELLWYFLLLLTLTSSNSELCLVSSVGPLGSI